jgi:hypothetical protein
VELCITNAKLYHFRDHALRSNKKNLGLPDGEGCRRSQRRRDPIDRLVPGANNIRSYPETVWKSDSDGKLERFNLWTFRKGLTKLAKLNRDVFTLTLGSRQIPPRALILSKKMKRIKFKQYCQI